MHFVVDDQLAGHFGGAVGIGLTVANDDLDIDRAIGGLDAATKNVIDLLDDKIVGFGKGGERAGLGRHITDLDGFALRHDGRRHGEYGQRRGRPQEDAPADRHKLGGFGHYFSLR